MMKEGTLLGMLISGIAYVILWYAGVNFTNSLMTSRVDKIEMRQETQSAKLEDIQLSTTKDIGEIKGDVKEIKGMLREGRK